MRKTILVFGCTLEDGSQVTCNDDGVVSVKVHPDHSVTIIRADNSEVSVEGKWVGYVPCCN